jgi:tetratricopeptide (TPR) repeat protein
MSVEYLFIIYSCKNNLERAESIYQRIHNNNGWKGCKVLILYGEYREKDPQYRIIDDKYMVINARDDYDHLYEKTTLLFNVAVKAFPSIKGLFKCDDDIVLHMQHIQLFLQLLTSNNDENQFTYCGKRIVRTKEFNEWSRKNGVDK